MSKPVVVMMVGLVGSGKSYYAEKLVKEINATVFSSDKLREEMFGNVDEQSKNGELFQELHRRIKECLKSGKNAIYDATNISSKRRRSFLQELNKIDCERRCVIMATPYEQCLKNNASRDRKVPEEVIDRMYRSWNTPYWFEGWDDIEVVYWEGSKNKDEMYDWVNNHMGYNQDNPHHELTLGYHCFATAHYTELHSHNNSVLFCAGMIHDNGKTFTKKFENGKGEPTKSAHYYSHEHVGAYNALFFEYFSSVNPLDVSILVDLHMLPYYFEKQKPPSDPFKLVDMYKADKYRKLWGENLFEQVIILHRADKAAH